MRLLISVAGWQWMDLVEDLVDNTVDRKSLDYCITFYLPVLAQFDQITFGTVINRGFCATLEPKERKISFSLSWPVCSFQVWWCTWFRGGWTHTINRKDLDTRQQRTFLITAKLNRRVLQFGNGCTQKRGSKNTLKGWAVEMAFISTAILHWTSMKNGRGSSFLNHLIFARSSSSSSYLGSRRCQFNLATFVLIP